MTTCEITTTQQAQECLRWYGLGSHCLRWRIEDWQRVLKSACRIEALQHETAERLKRASAIHLVLGWRIMQMTLLAQASPDLPAERLFSNLETEVRQGLRETRRIDKPTRLGDAVGIVARLGGTIGRAKDARPQEPDHLAGLFGTAVSLQRPVSAQWDIGLDKTIWIEGSARRNRP